MIKHTNTEGDDSLITTTLYPLKTNYWYDGFEQTS